MLPLRPAFASKFTQNVPVTDTICNEDLTPCYKFSRDRDIVLFICFVGVAYHATLIFVFTLLVKIVDIYISNSFVLEHYFTKADIK